jgi:hypothetical protein
MYSTLFDENRAVAMSPDADPEPSAFTFTMMGAGCTKPAITPVEPSASSVAHSAFFIFISAPLWWLE